MSCVDNRTGHTPDFYGQCTFCGLYVAQEGNEMEDTNAS